MSLEHGSRDGLLSPEILQTTSPSSGRHLPTSRWLPPSGYKLCSRCSLSSRRTSQSGPSSKARPEVSTVLLVTLRVSLAVSSPLQLDAEGTHEYLILALQIQGICSSSHIRPVIIKGTDAGGVLWVYGGLDGRIRTQLLTNPAHEGLCGNFNGDTTDDFTTSMGIDEGTASLFVDSWRAGNCPAALERETDPCSMSQLNSEFPAPPPSAI